MNQLAVAALQHCTKAYLNVFTFVPSCWQSESLEGKRALEANLDGSVLHTIVVSTL